MVYSISQTPQVWLDHMVSEQEGALVFYWDAVEDIFPAGMLDDMFASYCHLLERLVKEEGVWQETARSLVPVPRSHRELFQTVNSTQSAVSNENLYSLFAARVRELPDREAVVTSTMRLSYEKLCRYSNRAGHWLREKGAAPDSLVAVVMNKGWEQVVAVLGILNAGAAYLPIAADLLKGVMIDHRGAVNTILDINERFNVTPEDKILAVSALNFDLSVYDIFGMLAAGGTIVIPDAAQEHDPAHWFDLITREKITLWNSVPALIEMLVEYGSGRYKQLTSLLRLVLMVSIAEIAGKIDALTITQHIQEECIATGDDYEVGEL